MVATMGDIHQIQNMGIPNAFYLCMGRGVTLGDVRILQEWFGDRIIQFLNGVADGLAHESKRAFYNEQDPQGPGHPDDEAQRAEFLWIQEVGEALERGGMVAGGIDLHSGDGFIVEKRSLNSRN